MLWPRKTKLRTFWVLPVWSLSIWCCMGQQMTSIPWITERAWTVWVIHDSTNLQLPMRSSTSHGRDWRNCWSAPRCVSIVRCVWNIFFPWHLDHWQRYVLDLGIVALKLGKIKKGQYEGTMVSCIGKRASKCENGMCSTRRNACITSTSLFSSLLESLSFISHLYTHIHALWEYLWPWLLQWMCLWHSTFWAVPFAQHGQHGPC